MRQLTKEVKHTIDETEYTFQIKKMDALSCSYLLKIVLEKLLPVFSKAQEIFTGKKGEGKNVDKIVAERTNELMTMIPEVLASMTEEDLLTLEKRCLSTVSVQFPMGWRPLFDQGSFVIEELEYDVMTVLLLCYEVIDFNTESFFGGKSLGSALKSPST